MATQQHIDDLVNSVVNAYTGQHITYHDNQSTAHQCSAPVAYYVESVIGRTAPSMYGGTAEGWGKQFPGELAPFFTHETFQSGKAYPKGTILMWNSPHIAVVLSHDSGNIATVFQQNADPDGAPCKTAARVINNQWHTCTYAIVPIVSAPVVPASAPPTPASYSVVATYPEGKQIVLNKDTNLWGMNYHFDFMVAHPVEQNHTRGEIWTVTNKVHHENGYDYYRRDGQVDGFNVLDCDDYTPPPPPYVPPAEPLKGKPAETYVLDWEVPSFPTPLDAMSHKNANGKLTPKTYTVYAKNDLAYNLTEDNMKPGLWINTRDNVPPEVVIAPLPPKMTEAIKEAAAIADKLAVPQKTLRYEWLRGDHQPVYFHTLNAAPQRFKDLENPETTDQALLPVNKDIRFSMVTIKNGMDYFIPTVSLQNGHRHGIPETMLKEVGVSVPQVKQPNRLDHNNDGRVNIEDITTLMFDYGNKYLKPGVTAVVNTVKAVKKTRFVDGIIAGTKKEKVK